MKTHVERRTRILPVIVITALATTAVNLLVLAWLGHLTNHPPGPRAVLTDAAGHEQLRAELTEGEGEIVFLTLAQRDDRVRVGLRPDGHGQLLVSVPDQPLARTAERADGEGAPAPVPSSTAASAARKSAVPANPTFVLLPSPSPPESAAQPGGLGAVRGVVRLNGRAPAMDGLNRASDPFCAKTRMRDQQVIESANHTLKNVLIHINGAPPTGAPREVASIEQSGCMYRPRVQAIVAGQTLSIKNGDPVLHNVHTYKGRSTLFNQAQVPGTPSIDKRFTESGALLKFTCDVHPWMAGYVWVQNNPYFAVTADDGSFEIMNVPAGRYEVEVWHERFGTKKGFVVIPAGGAVTANFEFLAQDQAATR